MSKIDEVTDYQLKNMIKGVERDYLRHFKDGYVYDDKYLYEEDFGEMLSPLLGSLHYWFTNLFEQINDQIKNNHYFWAQSSRDLIKCIDISQRLLKIQPLLNIGFQIDSYYLNIITQSKGFLENSQGSQIPEDFQIIEIFYTIPIFKIGDSISKMSPDNGESSFILRPIGEGSYSTVYVYYDTFYNKNFVVKKAKKDLLPKEISRFYKEYEIMKSIKSPYVLEVYSIDEEKKSM